MALIELYRITGDKRQLDLAGYILQGDERINSPSIDDVYMYSGTPFTARTQTGRTRRARDVRVLRCDRLFMETGDSTYWKTLNTLWNDLTTTKCT